jgi:xanthine dehydrogenase YagR molybdenum-binding subunit
MVMGLSMALHEESPIDAQFRHFPHHDPAGYHVATNLDVPDIEASWIDEDEQHLGPLGIKGIGKIGTVGTAAAIANAVHHATGVRVRDLPIRLDKVLPGVQAATSMQAKATKGF